MRKLKTIAAAAALLSATAPAAVHAQTPYLGEVRIMPYTFCPEGWQQAGGQLLPVASYNALFSLYGTTFGGDGRTSFGLPNLSGRAPMGSGNGPGLTPRIQGQVLGQPDVTLTVAEMPAHNHAVRGTTSAGNTGSINNAGFANATGVIDTYRTSGALTQASRSDAISQTGGNQSHENRQPSLAMRYCVAMEGIYPPRS